MKLYHTTNRGKKINTEGLRNVRKKDINHIENFIRRKILDNKRPQEFKEFKTQKAIYFFRENELGKNLKVHFNNTIFIVDSEKLDRSKIRVFSYSIYQELQRTWPLNYRKRKNIIKRYWNNSLTLEDYEVLEKKGEIDYIPEFLYFNEIISLNNINKWNPKKSEKEKILNDWKKNQSEK